MLKRTGFAAAVAIAFLLGFLFANRFSPVQAKEKPGADPRSEIYQGGNFVLAEIGGDPNRITPKLKRRKPRAKR